MSTSGNKRDRRKAKQSGWAREGTERARLKHAHKLRMDPSFDSRIRLGQPQALPQPLVVTRLQTGEAVTNLGRLLKQVGTG